jgi:hypothetical protein
MIITWTAILGMPVYLFRKLVQKEQEKKGKIK